MPPELSLFHPPHTIGCDAQDNGWVAERPQEFAVPAPGVRETTLERGTPMVYQAAFPAGNEKFHGAEMNIICRNRARGASAEARRRGSAFSLIELIVVLALMLVFALMFRGSFARERDRQRLKACAANLAGQYVALQTYANDHEGWFPLVTNAVSPSEPLAMLIPKYTTQTGFWICPASGDKALKPAQPFNGRRISYAYYMGWRRDDPPFSVLASDAQVNDRPKRALQPLFSADGKPPGNNHGAAGGSFLRLNGSTGRSESHATNDFPLPEHIRLLNPEPR